MADASSVATLARHHPVVFYVFDLLYLDGHDLRGAPLIERKRLLKEVLQPNDVVRYSEDFTRRAELCSRRRKQQGIEGIIGKKASSFYESRRSGDWVKYKVHSSDSFLLCGFTEGERDHFGALVLGIHDGGKLKWAGNVGTGFDRKIMKAIHDEARAAGDRQMPAGAGKEPAQERRHLGPAGAGVRGAIREQNRGR